jgi:predicted AAA+ superfamily ATPase
MRPIDALEVTPDQLEPLWVRGGFPDSLLAANDVASRRWRQDFIRSYLERDVPMLGPRIPAETLRRFWTMLAHQQSGLFNASELARSLAIASNTVATYLDLMIDLLLVRRLEPWHGNISKRLVKSPRVYVRDSGLVHTLLGLTSLEDILGHPVAGTSWEGFAIETLIAAAPDGTQANFYRTAAGAEIDLLLTVPGQGLWAFEIKRSLAPKVERGFHHACADLNPTRRILVYPGRDSYPIGDGIEVTPLRLAGEALLAAH